MGDDISDVGVKTCWKCDLAITDILSTRAYPNGLAIITVIARCPICACHPFNFKAVEAAIRFDVWGVVYPKVARCA